MDWVTTQGEGKTTGPCPAVCCSIAAQYPAFGTQDLEIGGALREAGTHVRGCDQVGLQLPCPAAAGSRSSYKLLQDPLQSSQYLASGERKSFWAPHSIRMKGASLLVRTLSAIS
jgi:hypothetical protein